MNNNRFLSKLSFCIVAILLMLSACNVPSPTQSDTTALTQTLQALDQMVAATSTALSAAVQTTSEEPVVEPPTEELPPATETPVPTATQIVHTLRPGEPGWIHRWFYDTDSSITASQKKAPGGDVYYENYYERPFSETEMIYQPDIDIQKAEVSSDDNFFYFTIYPNGLNPQSGDLTGTYGAEIDTDLDGRGDFLFLCAQPNQNEWAVEMATAYKDGNNDVGGAIPGGAEAPHSGNGYEQEIFSLNLLSDPDALWCRKAPGSELKINIAVKKSLAQYPTLFAWGTLILKGQTDPTLFDFNDHFTGHPALCQVSQRL